MARREHCTAELRVALASRGFLPDAIEPALADLADERLLDDERYAASMVRVHVGRGQGPRRIRQEMLEAGLPAHFIDQALAAAPDWRALAADIRRRRFGEEPPSDWAERARQARFLQYRGFSNDHIRSALGSSGADDLPDDADP
jgi:regulatory protein